MSATAARLVAVAIGARPARTVDRRRAQPTMAVRAVLRAAPPLVAFRIAVGTSWARCQLRQQVFHVPLALASCGGQRVVGVLGCEVRREQPDGCQRDRAVGQQLQNQGEATRRSRCFDSPVRCVFRKPKYLRTVDEQRRATLAQVKASASSSANAAINRAVARRSFLRASGLRQSNLCRRGRRAIRASFLSYNTTVCGRSGWAEWRVCSARSDSTPRARREEWM